MKPTKLLMSAFGPYGETAEVDFTRLGQQGLYLICGPTGAGKSSIFDALTFALYGKASGRYKKDEPRLLRSDYAQSERDTFVELTFTFQGKSYTIKRSPDYTRPKKRGQGETARGAEAYLYDEGGRLLAAKVKEVNQAVEELLGLNYEQFTQIALIAQGDFQKLIMADTGERQRLYQSIFHTELYRRWQERLGELAKKWEEDYQNLHRSLEQSLATVEVKGQTGPQVLEGLGPEAVGLNLGETLAWLRQLVEEDRGAYQQAEAELRDLQAAQAEVGQKLTVYQQAAACQKELDQCQRKAPDLAAATAAAQGKQAQAQAARAESQGLAQAVQDLGRLAGERQQLGQELQKKEQAAAQAATAKEQAEQGLAKAQQAYQEAQKAGREAAELEKEELQLQNRLGQLDSLAKAYQKWQQAEQDWKAKVATYEKAKQQAAQSQAGYRQARTAFYNAQAGLLAQELEPGRPCPVCGSCQHPAPAAAPATAPSQDQLQTLEEAARQGDKAQAAAAAAAGSAVEQVAAAEADFTAQGRALYGVAEAASICQQAGQERRQLQGRQQVLAQLLPPLQAAAGEEGRWRQELERGQGELPGLERAYQAASGELEQARGRCQRAEEELARQAAAYGQSLAGGIDPLLADLQQRSRDLAAQAQDWEEELSRCQQAEQKNQGSLATLAQQLQELGPYDQKAEEAALARQAELAERRQQVADDKEGLYAALSNNEKVCQYLAGKEKELRQAQERRDLYRQLSNSANGVVKGKQRVDLETYAQLAYFDQVLAQANVRLLQMTQGQYELERQEEGRLGKKTGLELVVRDHYYNSKPRSVKTLSGGESFQASLALALGLADVVQKEAGGLGLDALFIDEGFGSLDEGALQQAVETLYQLAGGRRLVGIISHVQGLAERIDKKIIVSKAEAGQNLSSRIQIEA